MSLSEENIKKLEAIRDEVSKISKEGKQSLEPTKEFIIEIPYSRVKEINAYLESENITPLEIKGEPIITETYDITIEEDK